jgi:hypothetical protein
MSEWILKYIFNVKIKNKKEAFTKFDLEHFFQQNNNQEIEEASEHNKKLFENATPAHEKTNKNNKAPDNQHSELSSKYSEGRHELDTPLTSEMMPTSDANYWPPAECDNLFPIISSIKENGTLKEKTFDKTMRAIFGKISKTKSPVIKVTSRHIIQLEALQKQLPQDDRSYVEVWIKNFRYHEEKDIEGNTST